jgi:hypothetical protein
MITEALDEQLQVSRKGMQKELEKISKAEKLIARLQYHYTVPCL